jgi:hypothetical protein
MLHFLGELLGVEAFSLTRGRGAEWWVMRRVAATVERRMVRWVVRWMMAMEWWRVVRIMLRLSLRLLSWVSSVHSWSECAEKVLEQRLWVIDVDVGLGLAHRVVNGGHDDVWSISGSLELQESMRMSFGLLTLLTEVKVFANATFVANSDNGGDTAAVTLNARVDLVWVHRFVEWIGSLPSRGAVDLV